MVFQCDLSSTKFSILFCVDQSVNIRKEFRSTCKLRHRHINSYKLTILRACTGNTVYCIQPIKERAEASETLISEFVHVQIAHQYVLKSLGHSFLNICKIIKMVILGIHLIGFITHSCLLRPSSHLYHFYGGFTNSHLSLSFRNIVRNTAPKIVC